MLDESARASLRSALWALRRQLGEEANGALVATRDRVGLGDGVWVDVSEAERLRAAGQLEEALALAEGELLPGLEDEWAFEARDEHRARTAAVLEQLAAASEEAGDLRRAADLSRRAAALDPLSEEAHRSLMRRLAAAGDRAAALTAFSELRTRLLQTLRVGPSEETRRIAESLRADAPAERVPAPLRRIDTQLFVGRATELGRLAHLRDRHAEGVGVGLIAGEAGSGKTRLAARFAVDSAALGATVLYGCCAEEALVPYEPFADAVGESGLDAAALEERLASVPGDRLFLVLDDLQWADRATLGAAEPARAGPPCGAAARRRRLPGGRSKRAALRSLRRPSAQLCRRADRALRPRRRGNGNADRRRLRDERRGGAGARDPRPDRRQPVLRARAGAPCR